MTMTSDAGAVTIRRATDDDAAALAEFGRRTFEETFGPDNDPGNLAIYVARAYGPARQLAEIRDPDGITLISEHQGVIAGYAQVHRLNPAACVTDPHPVELRRFYVDRPFQGRGLARRQMRAVLDAARALGGETVWLAVWERNPRAMAFYNKCGFRDVGAQTFQMGPEEQYDRVYARPIAELLAD